MVDDPSAGWEAVATQYAAIRSDIGADVVRAWSSHLRPGGAVVDIGCGAGAPVSAALAARGFDVHGIDPSPTLLAAYRRRLPGAPTACETVEESSFFDRRFDGAVAVGVIFLLPAEHQHILIQRVAGALHRDGHFLFSAPRQECRWNDMLTGRPSRSLGEEHYRHLLADAGFRFVNNCDDAGSNHYYHAIFGPA